MAYEAGCEINRAEAIITDVRGIPFSIHCRLVPGPIAIHKEDYSMRMPIWMVGFITLAYSIVSLGAEPRVSYQGFSQVQVVITSKEQLDALEQIGVNILNCHVGQGPLQIIANAGQLDDLTRRGIPYQIQVADVEDAMNRQAIANAQRVAVLGTADPFDDFFLDYRDYSNATGGIIWYLNQLASRYPGLAQVVSVGTTLQGNTIYGIKVTNQATSNKPAVVYFGAEHAREWISTTVGSYFANYLLSNYGIDSTVTDLVDNVEFYLIPVYNVDGYNYTRTTNRLWRKNRRNNGNGTFGVDINRNWGAGWGGEGSSGVGSSETYRGTAAFSEPETQAMRDFFIAHPNVRAQLDLHSYSQLILWPYGYSNTLPADQDVYADVGFGMETLMEGVFGTQFVAGPIYSTIYPASGGSCDWTYDARGILSFSYELRDQGFYQFELPADQIVPSNLELLGALKLLANSNWVRDPLRFRFPNGLPMRLQAGVITPINVEVIAQSQTVSPGGVKMYYRPSPTDSYTEIVMTPTGGNGYQADLPAMSCGASPEYYFSASATGGSQVKSPEDAPSLGTYSTTVTTNAAVAFEQLMSSNPGWTTQGQWAFGTPTGAGGQNGFHDPTSGHTGTSVYGYNLSGDYANNLGEQNLTTGPINCTGRSGVRLSYWRWLGVEQSQYDHASIRISTNGTNWTTVWQNASEIADSAWTLHEIELGDFADNQPTVYLRWTMGPTDSAARYCGWNIDDVQILSDECITATASTPLAEPAPIVKPRFISFQIPPSQGGTAETALRVNLTSLHHVNPPYAAGATTPFTVFEGQVRWVGPPTQFVESTSSGTPFMAAQLQCTPYYQDWSTIALLHVTGSAIVPSSSYEIVNVSASCMGAEGNCVAVSGPLSVSTARWGDVETPFNPPSTTTQPDLADVSAMVNKFKDVAGAPIKARTLLSGENLAGEIDMSFDLDFEHIAACVDAFKGKPYPFTIASCP